MSGGGPLGVLGDGMKAWYEAKTFIEHAIFFSSDALHVLVGTVVWVAIAMIWRRPLSNWRPWFALLGLLILNEAVDLWVERWPDLAMQYGESAKDLLLTMVLPGKGVVPLRGGRPGGARDRAAAHRRR